MSLSQPPPPPASPRRPAGSRPLIDIQRVQPAGRSQLWTDFSSGWTMVCELLAATFTWGGIGWLADRLLGIEPWLMCLGFLIGSAAGFYLVYVRSTRAALIEEELRAGKSRGNTRTGPATAVKVVVDRATGR